MTGREIAFKPATFYLGIADHLARVVEGQESQGLADDTRGVNLAESSSTEASDFSCQADARNRERGDSSSDGGLETTGNFKRTDNDTIKT